MFLINETDTFDLKILFFIWRETEYVLKFSACTDPKAVYSTSKYCALLSMTTSCLHFVLQMINRKPV